MYCEQCQERLDPGDGIICDAEDLTILETDIEKRVCLQSIEFCNTRCLDAYREEQREEE